MKCFGNAIEGRNNKATGETVVARKIKMQPRNYSTNGEG
jgi:hypothetical protein